MAEEKISYKEAYARLEEIVKTIEENKLDVDGLAEKLKEASALLKVCKDKLFAADEETKKILDAIKD